MARMVVAAVVVALLTGCTVKFTGEAAFLESLSRPKATEKANVTTETKITETKEVTK